MIRMLTAVVLGVTVVGAAAMPARAWIVVDSTGAPGVPLSGFTQIVSDIDSVLSKNIRHYPGAFALANVGGYPIGDATLGKFPHMFFGAALSVGCANMKYYDEHIPRENSVYPAIAPNANLYFGFGLPKGLDLIVKAMVFNDAMWRPPINQESVRLSKMNYYSAGGKVRKNLVGEKTLLPNFLGFGGFTVSAGADFMNGIIGINGHYDYRLGTIFLLTPAPGFYNLMLDAYYNFNLKWLMVSANAQAIAYFNFLWIFDLYLGLGMAMTWGNVNLGGSGLGTLTVATPADVGYIRVKAGYKYRPKAFMGLFITGLEINIWVLKVNVESMVNISNGRDINIQLGSRVQF